MTVNGSPYRHVLPTLIRLICDHVKTLFDSDIELRQMAVNKGMRLERIAMLNDSLPLIETLHDVATAHESSLNIQS